MPLSCQKHAFSLPDDVHYLNGAYMSPLPRVTEEVGVRSLRIKRFPVDIAPSDFFEESDAVRARFARLVNAPRASRIALIPSASYAIATAARNLPVAAGQNIVLLHEQFPGNLYTWRRKAVESGAEIRTIIPPDGASRGRRWNERILDGIDGSTAIVTLPHVHWTDGTLFDLEAIARRAREVGAAVVIDATQSVGALPFDVQGVQPDVLVVATYKWLLGPYSCGLAYYGERFDDGVPLEETWIGRKGSQDFQHLVDYQDEYEPGAVRYDVGERSNFALLPMVGASLDLLLEWGVGRIQEYTRTLSSGLLVHAAERGFVAEEEAFRAGHIFGLRMPEGLNLTALQGELADRKIYISLRGSALRVSVNVYNDEADMQALSEVLDVVTA